MVRPLFGIRSKQVSLCNLGGPMILDSHYAYEMCNVTDRWSAAGLEFEISIGPGSGLRPGKRSAGPQKT